MMQTAKARKGDDVAIRRGAPLRPSVCRRFFPQAKVRPVFVMIADVAVQKPSQVVFIEYDDMVEQITPARPNKSFCNAVLPWTLVTRSFRLETETLDGFYYLAVEIRGAIKNQIPGCAIVGEGLSQLLRHPGARGMPRGIEMKNPSSLMRNHEETVQHTKGERRHGEEVHRCKGVTMVAQERRPSRGRLGIPGGFAHPAQDSTLGEIETEHLQFAVNVRSTPGRVFSHHAEDELSGFLAFRPSARGLWTAKSTSSTV